MQLLRNTETPAALRIRREKVSCIAISSVVLHELYYGAYKSRRVEHNLDLLRRLRFEVLDFNVDDARCAGEVRAALALRGTPIDPCDVLIAGQAKARGRILVSHNLKEFERIDGLVVEDWTNA